MATTEDTANWMILPGLRGNGLLGERGRKMIGTTPASVNVNEERLIFHNEIWTNPPGAQDPISRMYWLILSVTFIG